MSHRRPRRDRRAVLAAAVLVAIVLVASCGYAVVRASSPQPEPVGGPGPAGGAAAASRPAGPPPRPPGSAPAEPASPRAMLQLLVQLLPPGTTSAYATFSGRDELIADLRYRRDGTTNGVRAVLTPDAPAAPDDDASCGEPVPVRPICRTVLPNGATARLGPGPDCSQAQIAEVDQDDGSRVRVEVSSCRGPGDDPRTALSPGEVLLIAADDQWGRTMPAELVRAGRARFTDAPRIRNPFTPPRT